MQGNSGDSQWSPARTGHPFIFRKHTKSEQVQRHWQMQISTSLLGVRGDLNLGFSTKRLPYTLSSKLAESLEVVHRIAVRSHELSN